jgi:hypothetical protein
MMKSLADTPVLNGGKTAENRRDPHGRFVVGTAPGPGRPRNPFARRQAGLRRAMLAEVHGQDVRALVRVLLTRALAGDLKAAEVLFVLCQKGLPLCQKDLPFGLKETKTAHGMASGSAP